KRSSSWIPCCSILSQISPFELQTLVLTGRPLAKQDGGRVFAEEVGAQGLFEGSAEEHGGPGILLSPAVEVAMAIASRAGKVLTDLGVAIDHEDTSDPR